jgi:hypothetical protein
MRLFASYTLNVPGMVMTGLVMTSRTGRLLKDDCRCDCLTRSRSVKIPSGWLFSAITMQLILAAAMMATASLRIVSGETLMT